MTEKELRAITDWLIENVFRNPDIMYDDYFWEQEIYIGSTCFDLVDVIATLHNLLYEQVTGKKYDYMFHWCNKIGSDCNDNVFDELISTAEAEKE